MTSTPTLSIVVPLYNEAGNLAKLFEEITHTLHQYPAMWEVIFVNDGSRDSSQTVIEELHTKDSHHVRGIQFKRNAGKAAALQSGFRLAKGEVIITMDADLQDDPQEIPRFLEKLAEGYGLVSGWKERRKDSWLKNSTSKFFNAVTRHTSGINLRDFNCGFKAYLKEATEELHLYGELHRYIPVLVDAQGYTIAEIPVHHRKRYDGRTKYGALRFLHGFFDLATVIFITRYKVRPLHLFGYVGLSCFGLGFLGGLYLTVVKLLDHVSIGERPLLLLSVMLMIMGVQIMVLGLIGEQIAVMHYQDHPETDRLIKKIIA